MSDALLLEPPDLAAWPDARFLLTRSDGQIPPNPLTVLGDITEVPEPRRALLLAAGIATAAVLRAGRRPDPRRVAR